MSSPPDTPAKARRGSGLTTPSRRGGSGRVLADVIVDLGFVDRAAMDAAIAHGTASGSASERILVADGTLSDEQLSRAVAERFGLDHVDLKLYRVDPDAAKLVAPAAVRRYQAVPVSFVGDRTLLVAMVDPANVLAIDDIAVMTGYEVRPAVSSRKDVEWLLERLEDPDFGHGAIAPEELEDAPPEETPAPLYDLRENAPIHFGAGGEDATVIQLVHRVIREAVERGASDVHFEPAEEDMRNPLPDRRRAPRSRDRPAERGPRRHQPRQDPLRPRHRRAPHPAGRPHLAGRREQADRSPRRDASRRLRREGGHANPRPEQGHDRARAARHAAAGA